MACEICGKSTSSIAKKEGPADICFACRSSDALQTVWLHRLSTSELRFSLEEEFDGPESLVETLPSAMPRKAVALLRDLDRRGAEDDIALDLVMVIWDTFPTMIANALAAKKK